MGLDHAHGRGRVDGFGGGGDGRNDGVGFGGGGSSNDVIGGVLEMVN